MDKSSKSSPREEATFLGMQRAARNGVEVGRLGWSIGVDSLVCLGLMVDSLIKTFFARQNKIPGIKDGTPYDTGERRGSTGSCNVPCNDIGILRTQAD